MTLRTPWPCWFSVLADKDVLLNFHENRVGHYIQTVSLLMNVILCFHSLIATSMPLAFTCRKCRNWKYRHSINKQSIMLVNVTMLWPSMGSVYFLWSQLLAQNNDSCLKANYIRKEEKEKSWHLTKEWSITNWSTARKEKMETKEIWPYMWEATMNRTLLNFPSCLQ